MTKLPDVAAFNEALKGERASDGVSAPSLAIGPIGSWLVDELNVDALFQGEAAYGCIWLFVRALQDDDFDSGVRLTSSTIDSIEKSTKMSRRACSELLADALNLDLSEPWTASDSERHPYEVVLLARLKYRFGWMKDTTRRRRLDALQGHLVEYLAALERVPDYVQRELELLAEQAVARSGGNLATGEALRVARVGDKPSVDRGPEGRSQSPSSVRTQGDGGSPLSLAWLRPLSVWQWLGAAVVVVAVVAVIYVASLAWPSGRASSSAADSVVEPASSLPSSPSSSPTSSGETFENGDTASGSLDQDVVSGSASAFSFIALEPYSIFWVAPDSGAGLPTPPPYPPDAHLGHCEYWDTFFRDEGFFPRSGETILGFGLGYSSRVDIVGIRFRIFSAEAVSADSLVGVVCQHGADGFPGTSVQFDLREPGVPVSVFEDEEFPMPPGAIRIEDPVYDGVSLEPSGTPGTMYEYGLVLTAIVEGVEQELILGTSDSPLRWYAEVEEEEAIEFSDWDMNKSAWITDLPPSVPIERTPGTLYFCSAELSDAISARGLAYGYCVDDLGVMAETNGADFRLDVFQYDGSDWLPVVRTDESVVQTLVGQGLPLPVATDLCSRVVVAGPELVAECELND